MSGHLILFFIGAKIHPINGPYPAIGCDPGGKNDDNFPFISKCLQRCKVIPNRKAYKILLD